MASRTPAPDQLGFDTEVIPPPAKTPKRPPRTTPAQEVVAAYAKAYAEHHQRASLRYGQVGRLAKMLLGRKIDLDLLKRAAERLGETDHGNLESVCDEITREAPPSWPQGWGPVADDHSRVFSPDYVEGWH